jgi:hypothetical protein
MIVTLFVNLALFVAFRKIRRFIPPVVAIIGFVETQAFSMFPEGVGLGILTLTCAGLMTTVYFRKILVLKVVIALAFAALGGFLTYQAIDSLSKMSLSIMSNLTSWTIMLSWALTTLLGGLLILIFAFNQLRKPSTLRALKKE